MSQPTPSFNNMSAAQQTPRSTLWTGINSFVLDMTRANDILLAPKPTLEYHVAFDTNSTGRDWQNAQNLLTEFGSIVKERFEQEFREPAWKFWTRTWLQWDDETRESATIAKREEWHVKTLELIAEIHRTNPKFSTVGWDVYSKAAHDEFLQSLSSSNAVVIRPRGPDQSGRVQQYVDRQSGRRIAGTTTTHPAATGTAAPITAPPFSGNVSGSPGFPASAASLGPFGASYDNPSPSVTFPPG